MLPHYSAFKVAEQLRVLDALAPGRIDLGVGRAPGGDQRTARLLNPHASAADTFPQQVVDLQAFVTGQPLPPGHPGQGVPALPQGATAPSVWMLGSSGYGAQLAAHLGLPYAFAYFITDGEGADEALEMYRAAFRPGVLARPQATVCVWALAADTEEEAWFQFRTRERWKMDRNLGRVAPLLPPGETERPWSPAEEFQRARLRQGALVGSGPQVATKLRALADRLEVDEVVVITWTWDAAVQRRSYELLAGELGLS